VTLWGESAGAISACDHTIINGGDASFKDGTLFRAAILNSGSTTPTVPVDHPKAQAIYDTVVSAAGCAGKANSLDCLRALPFEQVSDAFATVPSFFGRSSVDLSYLPRPDPIDNFMPISPEAAVQSGKFAKVPVIIGDQQDEGTLFALTQSNISTTEDLVDYITPVFPLASQDIITGLVNAYPDDPMAGSPYNTFGLNNIYPQFKRLASMLGDVSFTLQRRSYLATITSEVPAWSYIANYLPLTPVLGTFHASDILSTFYDVPPVLTTDSILQYYISFINSLDPNAIPNKKAWPRYDTQKKQLLEFGALSLSVITDDFRQDSYTYFVKNQDVLRI
jgi:carboxylesterase type B